MRRPSGGDIKGAHHSTFMTKQTHKDQKKKERVVNRHRHNSQKRFYYFWWMGIFVSHSNLAKICLFIDNHTWCLWFTFDNDDRKELSEWLKTLNATHRFFLLIFFYWKTSLMTWRHFTSAMCDFPRKQSL